MSKKKTQINFRAPDLLVEAYRLAGESGLNGARLCSAGLLMMMESPLLRQLAMRRFTHFEESKTEVGIDDVAIGAGDEPARIFVGAIIRLCSHAIMTGNFPGLDEAMDDFQKKKIVKAELDTQVRRSCIRLLASDDTLLACNSETVIRFIAAWDMKDDPGEAMRQTLAEMRSLMEIDSSKPLRGADQAAADVEGFVPRTQNDKKKRTRRQHTQ